MFLSTFAALLGSLALASSRDAGRFMKTVPTISHSLVNLGKMEVSFYINGQGPSPLMYDHNMQADFTPVNHIIEQSCSCPEFKPNSPPAFLSNPSEIINKILKSNDFFKEPTSSVCCGSHEHTQDSTVFFEFVPNHGQNFNVQRNAVAIPPFPFPRFLNKASPLKSKVVEILLFPKRKDLATLEFTNFTPRRKDPSPSKLPTISEVVETRGLDLKHTNASVKKDLAHLEKKNKQDLQDEELTTVTPIISYTNNNAL